MRSQTIKSVYTRWDLKGRITDAEMRLILTDIENRLTEMEKVYEKTRTAKNRSVPSGVSTKEVSSD
jgi:hypothetical protein